MDLSLEIFDVSALIFENPTKTELIDLLEYFQDKHYLVISVRTVNPSVGVDPFNKSIRTFRLLSTTSDRYVVQSDNLYLCRDQADVNVGKYVSMYLGNRSDQIGTIIIPANFTLGFNDLKTFMLNLIEDQDKLPDFRWRELPSEILNMDDSRKIELDKSILKNQKYRKVRNVIWRFTERPHYGYDLVLQPDKHIISNWIDHLNDENNCLLVLHREIKDFPVEMALFFGDGRIHLSMVRYYKTPLVLYEQERTTYLANLIAPEFVGDLEELDYSYGKLPDPIILDDMSDHEYENAIVVAKRTFTPLFVPQGLTVTKYVAKEVVVDFMINERLRSDLRWLGDMKIFDF